MHRIAGLVRILTAVSCSALYSNCRILEEFVISSDPNFSDCVVLDKDSFDPDAVFLDDIVDDEVLPRLSLAVEGLTDTLSVSRGDLEVDADARQAQPTPSPTAIPDAPFDPEHLEVYGWESSFWRKLRGYLGF